MQARDQLATVPGPRSGCALASYSPPLAQVLSMIFIMAGVAGGLATSYTLVYY